MRNWRIGLAVIVGLLGGCADARQDSPVIASDPGIARIQAFIAAQRETDSRSCAEQGHAAGTAPHLTCVRELAARRRAALQGGTHEKPADGWCRSNAAATPVRCVEI